MTTPAYLRAHVLPAAYALLPEAMQSRRATAVLLAIALQESGCVHRDQHHGPAVSFWQFERTGIAALLGHRASQVPLVTAAGTLRYAPTVLELHRAIEHNDVLAAVCARLLLWTLPDPLPASDQPEIGWQQYVAAWRPGKPRPDDWGACWRAAWEIA